MSLPPQGFQSGVDTGLAYKGTVTAVPGANQFTISSMIGMGVGKFDGATNPYSAFVFRKGTGTGGAPQGEIQVVTSFDNNTGNFTTAGFTVDVAVDDEVILLHPSLADILSGSSGGILGIVTAIQTQTNKLAGVATVSNAVVGNWQTAETDLVTIGANGTSNKLHLLIVDIANLVGNITIRLYHRVNGVERCIYPIPNTTTFAVATDQPGIAVINASLAITEALRVTVQSDNAADNGQSVAYEYKLESM